MRFQTHLCWYLDATFCYSFHGYQEQGIDVLLSMRLVLFGLFTFALCCVGYITAMAVFTALNFGHPLGRDSEAEARTEIVPLVAPPADPTVVPGSDVDVEGDLAGEGDLRAIFDDILLESDPTVRSK